MKNFDSFGVMLDCSRNAVPNVPELKKFIGIISKMGYNFVMLYTEDTYEVENEPYFGYMRGRYSAKEIRDIDAYCKKLGVELIPCVQTLAHFNAIFRWDAYDDVHDIDDVMLADSDRTYEIIENIFKSLSKEFSSRRVHIGMDEAHKVGLGKYLDIHGYQNRYELLMRHLNKVCDIAKKYGFEPMMWDDMFFR
ncbi:MAG: family 20 glycosylhydrolase, partial [Clostridiales bacterium]|nr:family 20 glycosylhydrolase [Clostridiales bacterium]